MQQKNLKHPFVSFDKMTMFCGSNEEENDQNLNNSLTIPGYYYLSINNSKSQYSMSSIHLLSNEISNRILKPGPDRLKFFLDLGTRPS